MQPSSYRVLMIAPTSFFADYGCHVRILEEARVLQRLGQRVTIVTYHNGNAVADLDIRRTMPIPWRRDYEVGSSRHKIGLDALLGIKTLELLAREKIDIIHAHLHEGALIGLVLGRLFHLPVVFDLQGSLTEEMIDHHFLSQNSRAHSALLHLEKWLDQTASVVLTSSIHSARLLEERFGCDPVRVHPLPDCVDTRAFRPAFTYDPALLADLRRTLGIPAKRKLIVYLGLLAEYQGTELLLEAVARILAQRDDVHLLLMGFPNEAYYQQRAAELGISAFVTFTGRIPYQQAAMYLALGDVATAPKLSLTEGAGKLLNYMAVGLPVVAFDTAVAREYLGLDGLLAVRGDVDSLADCLMACLSSPDLNHRMAQRLRQRAVDHFDWEAAGCQIIEIYRQLLGDLPTSVVSQPGWAASQK